MNRIDEKFRVLREKGRKALITYITAGDPNIEMTYRLVLEMEKAGADLIELGIPYSDPLADGPVIQRASMRALANGIKIPDIMNLVKSLRQVSDVPLIYLVYYNSVFKYGIEKFVSEARDVGIDGLIIPDLPLEERGEVYDIVKQHDIHLIPLVAPTSHERIKKITENAGGFVYCVSVTGVTGQRQELDTDVKRYMEEVASYTSLPRAIGFGISGPDMIMKLKDYCEGIIVGSAVVSQIERGEGDRERIAKNVRDLVYDMKSVL
ncbi:tryptophan synthase, alpha chain [Caldanaerobius fijiensis DSM 17918]|uniref:Tryptophan synthase alpha chain n=1 Tax=Caldanaerobius fijiensis DSM 17918 TaxID=1121256 RepID=A0A1M4TA38_9THEO|nr:tryptophan synthase subunit alpha [Caldanaerobius fijiensis]SHE41343.1 tryptophan synthase, alpha chain [Caldanaerobius fijiensis DSM 17918]